MLKKGFSIFIIGQLVITLISLLILVSQNAYGNPLEPTINIEIIEEKLTSSYNNNKGIVTFHGTVTATINQKTRVIVTLYAVDTWDSAEVSPNEFMFTENGEESFEIKVTVPKTEEYNTEGNVTIFGEWRLYPGDLSGSSNSDSAKIIVGQYFDFSISSSNSAIESNLGSEIKLDLTISNEGNFRDTFSIIILNEDELFENGINLELSSIKIEVPKGLSETISISVKIDKDINTYEQQIKIEVYSINGKKNNIPSEEFIFEIKLNEEKSFTNREFQIIFTLIFLITVIIIIIIWILKRKANKEY